MTEQLEGSDVRYSFGENWKSSFHSRRSLVCFYYYYYLDAY